MKFTVKRETWLRGEDGAPSFLLRADDGKMCCLGFLGLACGLDKQELRGRVTPSHCQGFASYPDVLKYLGDDSPISETIMLVNDKCSLTDSEREERLTELFAEVGIDVEFID